MPNPTSECSPARSLASSPDHRQLGFKVGCSDLPVAPPSVSIAKVIADAARRIAQEAPPLTSVQSRQLRALLQPAPPDGGALEVPKRSRCRTNAA